jgi:hypothetical protein
MAGRRTNLALFAVLTSSLVTGVLAFGIGTATVRLVLIVHGVLGVAIVVISPWKSVIARRGISRRRAGTSASLGFTVLIIVALVSGFLHSAGIIRSVGPLSIMQLHVGSALAAIPLLIVHVIARPTRLRRMDLSRRNLMRSGALVAAGAAVYASKEALLRVTSAPGGERRFTGSFETGSFEPETMPVTQWFDDSVQDVIGEDYVLHVAGRTFSVEELVRWDDQIRATLDCTGGWYSVQDWKGVRLDRLIRPSGRSIEVVSVTGYSRFLPAGEAATLLLATHVGGRPLSAGHGGPVRLVAPGRRGFWWVKWVERVSNSNRPSWLQPPFPLT